MTVLGKSRLRLHVRMQPRQNAWLQLGRIPKSRSSGSAFSQTRSMQMPHTTASLRALRSVLGTGAAAAPYSVGSYKQSNAALQLTASHLRVTRGHRGCTATGLNPPLSTESTLSPLLCWGLNWGLISAPSDGGLRAKELLEEDIPPHRRVQLPAEHRLSTQVPPSLTKGPGGFPTAPAWPCLEMEGRFGTRADTHRMLHPTHSPAGPGAARHPPAALRALAGTDPLRTAHPGGSPRAGMFSLPSSSSTRGSPKAVRAVPGAELCPAPPRLRPTAPGSDHPRRGCTGLRPFPAGSGCSGSCWELEERGDIQKGRTEKSTPAASRPPPPRGTAPRPHSLTHPPLSPGVRCRGGATFVQCEKRQRCPHLHEPRAKSLRKGRNSMSGGGPKTQGWGITPRQRLSGTRPRFLPSGAPDSALSRREWQGWRLGWRRK